MIYVIALLLLGIFVVLIGLVFKNKNDIYQEFTDFDTLVNFIQKKYKCEIQDQVPLYGFIHRAYISNDEIKLGISDKPILCVEVMLLLENKKIQIIESICPRLNTELKEGDFIAVLPFYNLRHQIWSYVTLAKLYSIYLGNNQGFKIQENYAKG